MSGRDDLISESNDRWAEAERRAQGVADHGLGEAVKKYYTLYFPAGLVVLITVGTLLAGWAFGPDLDWLASRMGFALAAVGTFITGLVYNAKKVRPAAELGRIDVLVSLTDDEQKRVRRQILGKAPVSAEHLAVARAAAVQHRKNLATQLIFLPMLPLVFLAQAIPGNSEIWWLMALGVAAYVVGGPMVAREFRRAGRFLASTASR